jgi:hypothetical protein
MHIPRMVHVANPDETPERPLYAVAGHRCHSPASRPLHGSEFFSDASSSEVVGFHRSSVVKMAMNAVVFSGCSFRQEEQK